MSKFIVKHKPNLCLSTLTALMKLDTPLAGEVLDTIMLLRYATHSRGGDSNLKVGVPVLLLFLLLHTNNTCEIIYVHVRRTDGRTKSARSRLRVVGGQKKWGGWAPRSKNLGGLKHPLPPPISPPLHSDL